MINYGDPENVYYSYEQVGDNIEIKMNSETDSAGGIALIIYNT